MKCNVCGQTLEEGMQYCPICGTKIQPAKEIIIHLKPEDAQVSLVVVWDDEKDDKQ
ncbi:MAG: zinc-ribbon domain-containing protein [Lachnospiraceae bacterium]|nr:zinc-ribbon domain-containing protein [Lachnospiraceae bacterium]